MRAGSDLTDSLVYNTYPQLQIKLFRDETSQGRERDRMSWEEYWDKVLAIPELLKGPVVDGRYQPHVIVGMSNGGMIVADLLGRIPIQGFAADFILGEPLA